MFGAYQVVKVAPGFPSDASKVALILGGDFLQPSHAAPLPAHPMLNGGC